MTRIFTLALILLQSGCVLVPDSIRPEISHMSHLSQHWPFTNHGTNYGVNMIEVMAHWDFRGGAYTEVGEGMALNRRAEDPEHCGEIQGPREQFIARAGWVIPLKRH